MEECIDGLLTGNIPTELLKLAEVTKSEQPGQWYAGDSEILQSGNSAINGNPKYQSAATPLQLANALNKFQINNKSNSNSNNNSNSVKNNKLTYKEINKIKAEVLLQTHVRDTMIVRREMSDGEEEEGQVIDGAGDVLDDYDDQYDEYAYSSSNKGNSNSSNSKSTSSYEDIRRYVVVI